MAIELPQGVSPRPRVAPGNARFLTVFRTYVQPSEWVTAEELTCRILPLGRKRPACVAEARRDIAQKLSNLNRFGHLDRRRAGLTFEYALPQKQSGGSNT